MSAIGNYYVHYHAKNYRNEGIIFIQGNGYGKTPTASDLQLSENYIDSKYRNNFNTSNREQRVNKLQKQYQEMIYGNTNQAIQFRESATQALNILLSENFGTAAGKVDTSNLLQSNINNTSVTKAAETLSLLDRETEYTYTEIRHLIKEIRRWINIIQQNEGTLEQLEKRANSNVSSIKANLTKILNQKVGLKRKNVDTNINYNLLNRYIQALKEINVPVINTQANQQGELGQWIAPWIQNFLSVESKKKGSQLVDELINIAKNNKRGTSGAYVSFVSGQNNIKKMIQKTKDEKITGKTAQINFKYHTSKADAVINLKSGLQNIEQLPSIKNYKSFNNLSIVSNTPLSDLLERSLSSEWAAHYANTMIAHADENSQGAFLSALRQEAQKSFNKLALYVGLIGYNKLDAATLFIVFNNVTKQVKIFDPFLLVQKLMNQNPLGGNFSINSSFGKATANLTKGELLTQNFAKSKEERIKNIEQHLHAHKIHVAISVQNI